MSDFAMPSLPELIAENGHVAFRCPVCSGHGAILVTRTEPQGTWGTVTSERKEACPHCFGFGRLPVPSWYREQGGER